MKIMLVCAGGLSTSLLMKKMQQWAEKNNIDLEVKAYGVSHYEDNYQNYDCILIGPQITYKIDEIKSKVNIPVSPIEPLDYAMGNVDNIIKIVKKMINGG